MTETGRGSLRPRTINLALLVPQLPMVKLPSGREVQLMPFTAEAYELWQDVQRIVQDAEAGQDVDISYFNSLLDLLLTKVLPDATPDDLASLGSRTEVKLAPCLAAAGQVDTVLAALDALEGKTTADPSTSLSGPRTTSGRRSRGTRSRSTKIGGEST